MVFAKPCRTVWVRLERRARLLTKVGDPIALRLQEKPVERLIGKRTRQPRVVGIKSRLRKARAPRIAGNNQHADSGGRQAGCCEYRRDSAAGRARRLTVLGGQRAPCGQCEKHDRQVHEGETRFRPLVDEGQHCEGEAGPGEGVILERERRSASPALERCNGCGGQECAESDCPDVGVELTHAQADLEKRDLVRLHLVRDEDRPDQLQAEHQHGRDAGADGTESGREAAENKPDYVA